MLKITTVIAASILLASCSKSPSGGAGSNNSVGSMIEAQFIDEPVKGLSIEAKSGNGVTKAQGKFNCRVGETVSFKIAGLGLGEAVCGEKIFVDDLISPESGHSAEKVAAIIQSFAVSSSGELDLTTAVQAMPANALQSVAFSGSDATFASALSTKVDQIKVDVPALASVIVAKHPDDMRTILDAALNAYSSVSDALKAILSQLAHGPLEYEDIPTQKFITLTGKLSIPDPEDNCYDFVQARASISQATIGAPYKMVVHKMASFDALDAYDAQSNECTSDYWCDTGILPAPKLITSSSINFFSTINQNNYSSVSVAVLNTNVSGEEVSITGTFKEDGTYSQDGITKSVSCKYTVTSEEVSIPAEGPRTEYGDDEDFEDAAPIASLGSWVGDITTCTNAAEFDIRDQQGALEIIADSQNPNDRYPTFVLSTTLHQVGEVEDGNWTESYFNSQGHYVISQEYTQGSFEAIFAGPSAFTFKYSDAEGNSCGGLLSPGSLDG